MNIKSKEKCQQMFRSKVEGCESIQHCIDVLSEILLGRRWSNHQCNSVHSPLLHISSSPQKSFDWKCRNWTNSKDRTFETVVLGAPMKGCCPSVSSVQCHLQIPWSQINDWEVSNTFDLHDCLKHRFNRWSICDSAHENQCQLCIWSIHQSSLRP
jgi:hypothetical protein